MFLGHYGLSLAAKRAAPRTSLGLLTLAGNLADCVWPILLLLGLERVSLVPGLMAASDFDFESYPWSHSLLTGLLAGAGLGLAVYAWKKDLTGALAVAALVPSHWLLDLPFHRPDLPLWPGGPKVGLGLWNSVPATLLLEGVLFLGGLWLYSRRTRPLDRAGSWGLWAMVAVLLLIYVGSMFSPAPADPSAIAWSSLTLWLFVPWTAWVDRHRALA
jgi:hypothetical protein